jgi:hypothetical protein
MKCFDPPFETVPEGDLFCSQRCMNDKLNEDEQEADTSEMFNVNKEVEDSMIVAPTIPMTFDDEDER